MATNKKPDYYVLTKGGKGDNAPNRQIGAAWKHSKGEGIGVTLFAAPISGELVLFTPKQTDTESED